MRFFKKKIKTNVINYKTDLTVTIKNKQKKKLSTLMHWLGLWQPHGPWLSFMWHVLFDRSNLKMVRIVKEKDAKSKNQDR